MRINKKDFPPIKLLYDKNTRVIYDEELGLGEEDLGFIHKFLGSLIAVSRQNIYTVSRSIEKMIVSNRARLMDYYLKEADDEMFSGAFIDLTMQVPSIEFYQFLPRGHGEWRGEERDDIFRYAFASFQGNKHTGDVHLVAMGCIDFIYNEIGIDSSTYLRCKEGDEDNCVRYMKFLFELHVFLKYADTEIVKIYGNQKKLLPDKSDYINNQSGMTIKFIDSRWLQEIIRLEGFKVRGHFRLQPCKDESGGWTRKLIYIHEFEKHGYHRRAQRDIEEDRKKEMQSHDHHG